MTFKIQTDYSWDRCTLRAIAKCSDNNNQLAPGVQSCSNLLVYAYWNTLTCLFLYESVKRSAVHHQAFEPSSL